MTCIIIYKDMDYHIHYCWRLGHDLKTERSEWAGRSRPRVAGAAAPRAACPEAWPAAARKPRLLAASPHSRAAGLPPPTPPEQSTRGRRGGRPPQGQKGFAIRPLRQGSQRPGLWPCRRERGLPWRRLSQAGQAALRTVWHFKRL